jgi:hypothetical protein
MKRLLATTLILITATALTFGQTNQTRDILIVGSWNIEDIQTGSGQKTDIMASHLRLFRLDVLALNHVNGNARRRNRQLDAIFEKANETDGQGWQYRLFENRTATDRDQLVGVAWNRSRVSLQSEVFRTVTDDGTVWRKPPHAAKFSAGTGLTDFVVVPVQLEAKSRESACLDGTRGQQAQDLQALLQRVRSRFSDDDIVAIGDTECVRVEAEAMARFSVDRSLDFEVGDLSDFIRGQGAYNRVMVPRQQPEFRSAGAYMVVEAEAASDDRSFSDHFLLLAPIRVLTDDD